MQRIFHTPEGVRDIYNGECSQKHHLQAEIYKVFRSYGYEEIETPSIEYFEVFSKEVGTVPSRDLYKFFDREGNTLVLRPDFTPSVSRACATYFNPDQQVVTLCYTGNTFVNNSSYQVATSKLNKEQYANIGSFAGIMLVYNSTNKDGELVQTAQHFFGADFEPADKSDNEIFRVIKNMVATMWHTIAEEKKLRADADGIRSKFRATTPAEIIICEYNDTSVH